MSSSPLSKTQINSFAIWSVTCQPEMVEWNQRVSVCINDSKLSEEELREYLNNNVTLCLYEIVKGEMKLKAKGTMKLAKLVIDLRSNRRVKLPLFRKVKERQEIDCEVVMEYGYVEDLQETQTLPKPNNRNSGNPVKPSV